MQSSHHLQFQSKMKMRDIGDDAEKIRRLKGLPKGLHLPFEIRNPWMKTTFEEDFILITEFAENEGPRDVLTLPSNGGGSFDKNAFALHVMSVDFQSQNRNAEFSITDDTQMVLSDKKAGMCAFVHHFTLYDIHARGYVRPFCMSYITDSKRKILSCLSNIEGEFQKIAKLFHTGNRVAFGMDLENRLVELLNLNEYLNFSWSQKNKSNIDDETLQKQREIYKQNMQETRKVVEVLKPHLKDQVILEKLRKLENQAEQQMNDFSLAPEHTGTELEAEEFWPSTLVTEMSPFDNTARRRARSLSSLDDLKLGGDIEMESFTSFGPSYLQNIKQLRNLHELCGLGAKEGINRLRNFVQNFSQEEIAIAIEKTEGCLVDPSTSLLSLGRSVVLNFTSGVDLKRSMSINSGKFTANMAISVLQRRQSFGSGCSACSTDSYKSCLDDCAFDSRRSSDGMLPRFVPSSSIHAELHFDDYDTFDSDTTPETPTSEFSVLPFDGGSHDNLSLGSFLVIDDHVFGRQTSEMYSIEQTRNASLMRRSRSLENLPSMVRKENPTKEQEVLCSSVGRVANVYGERTSGSADVKVPDDVSSELEENKMRDNKKAQHKPFVKKLRLEKDCSTKPNTKRPRCHVRNESQPLRCFAEEVCRPMDAQIGISGILEFRNNYSCGIHLIYALLSARPVVIQAKPENEREVRSLIATLWMFVSETSSCHGRAVIPWRKKALHITDLPCLRLVGLCKSNRRCLIPKSVGRYVSILDYETGIIVSPPYKGVFLKAAFSYRNSWPSNATLLAYMHSLFLELACKAYVLYYTCALGPALIDKASGDSKASTDEIEVLNRLGVHFSDAAIVQHFAEVIKNQQIDSYFSGNEEIKAQTIINDLSKCTKFRNLPPFNP
ncbi:guanine nucleotide exchange protein smcr8a isoform X2 [Exaiptasia diaphana]|uniref:UDENN FLCN/SMCR8-type domain-containing protein n=1 Tax=Exaiptasia diaphana TaxID=2652724 RepID=A0A913X807_EXADI|nr:guanine nucleotide exchange protein smcr8a isoform X2 [Exaiptasia diaphana]KXJ14395.1 Smith-Magenis syndrome chromosomal region candidate gene 8 protein [Exaiptasia diaphana]